MLPLIIWNGVLLTIPRMMDDHRSSSAVGLARDLADDGAVVFFDAAADRIGQQPLGEGLHEHVLLAQQHFAQARRPVERGAVRQDAGGIDRPGPRRRRVAPAAEAVEILQRKAERVHDPVADGALRIGPMLLHALTHGQRPRALRLPSASGTFGGGGGGGVPRSCSSTHLPRIVGAVRLG